MVDDTTRRAQRRTVLERSIGDSRRVQRRLIVVVPVGLAATGLCALTLPGWTPLVIVSALAFYGVGRYITAAHIADARLALRELDREPAPIDQREPDDGPLG